MFNGAQAGVSVQPANAPKVAVPSLENPACSVSAPKDGSQVYCDVPLAASIPLAVPSDAAIPLATQKKNTLLSRSQNEKASQALKIGKKQKEGESRKPTHLGRKKNFLRSPATELSDGKQQLLSKFFTSLNMPGATEESNGGGLVTLATTQDSAVQEMGQEPVI